LMRRRTSDYATEPVRISRAPIAIAGADQHKRLPDQNTRARGYPPRRPSPVGLPSSQFPLQPSSFFLPPPLDVLICPPLREAEGPAVSSPEPHATPPPEPPRLPDRLRHALRGVCPATRVAAAQAATTRLARRTRLGGVDAHDEDGLHQHHHRR